MGRKRQFEAGVLVDSGVLGSQVIAPLEFHQFAPGNPYLVGLPPLPPGTYIDEPAQAAPPVPAAAPQPEAPKKHVITQDSWRAVAVEPEVQDLADHFGLDERITGKLQEALNLREDPGEDLEALWGILDEARNPPGLTMIKVKEMIEGTFRAGEKGDPVVKALSERFKLDERATYKLGEVLASKPNRREILKVLEVHLAASNNPSALVMLRLADLRKDIPLGEVPYGTRGYRDRPYLGNRDKAGNELVGERGGRRERGSDGRDGRDGRDERDGRDGRDARDSRPGDRGGGDRGGTARGGSGTDRGERDGRNGPGSAVANGANTAGRGGADNGSGRAARRSRSRGHSRERRRSRSGKGSRS